MGRWAPDSFANDHARAWLEELETGGRDLVIEALRKVDEADEAPDPASSACAIAAAEVVAAMRNRPPDPLPPEVEPFVGQEPDEELLAMANRAVGRVFDDSELRDRWEDDDQFDAWEDAIGDLLDRLEPAGGRDML